MDSSTLLLAGTVLLGLVGAAVFLLSQPGETKTRSVKSGLKPRGASREHEPICYEFPAQVLLHCSQRHSFALLAEDLYAQ